MNGQNAVLLQNRGKSMEFVLEISELGRDSGHSLSNEYLRPPAYKKKQDTTYVVALD